MTTAEPKVCRIWYDITWCQYPWHISELYNHDYQKELFGSPLNIQNIKKNCSH